MAEERLIDEDKDRKYRIRKNENGEDELVLIDPEEEEEEDLPVYSVITDEDDGFTEEERVEKNAQRQQVILQKAEELKSSAREKLAAGDYDGAQHALSQAGEVTEYDGELYYLQLVAYSRNMTNFDDLQNCVDAAEGVREYSDEEQKSSLAAMSGALKEQIARTEERYASLSAENEAGKAERRGLFAAKRQNALTFFISSTAPFLLLLVLTIVFASKIFADKEGMFIILTAIAAAGAVIALFISLFFLSRFLEANRKVKMNENDQSTSVGRDYAACSEELENLKKIYSSFENDIS